MTLVAGVDLGGSGSRLVVAEVGGAHRAQRSFGPSFISSTMISTTVIDALESLDGGMPSISALCIGTTGMPGLLSDYKRLGASLFSRTPVDAVIVAGDSLTTHIGALGFAPGAVVAVGTGAIAFGTDFEEIWHRVDGWGHLLGDEGSGAWIGRRGLAAALAALDGRGGSPVLLHLLRERYESTAQLLDLVYRSGSSAFEVARFAPAVEEAAKRGDVIAQEIWAEAGRLIAGSAAAACASVEPNVSWGGGLFRAGALLRDPFTEELGRLVPGVRITAPVGGSLEGAVELAKAYMGGRRLPNTEFHQLMER